MSPPSHLQENLANFTAGLRHARGDRLVDVLSIIRYRVEQEPEEIPVYLAALLPPLQDLLQAETTDLGLRAAVAETLATFGRTLAQRSTRDTQPTALQRQLYTGFHLCFQYPTALVGKLAIMDALACLPAGPETILLLQYAAKDPALRARARAILCAAIPRGKSTSAKESKHVSVRMLLVCHRPP